MINSETIYLKELPVVISSEAPQPSSEELNLHFSPVNASLPAEIKAVGPPPGSHSVISTGFKAQDLLNMVIVGK